MKKPPEQTRTAPLLHLFNRNKASIVRFEDDILTVWAKSGRITQSVRADQIEEVQLQKQTLVNQLTVLTKQGRTITVNGLGRSSSTTLHTRLHRRVEELLDDEATEKAKAIAPEIIALRDSFQALLTAGRYVRWSHAQAKRNQVSELDQQLGGRVRQKLDNDARQALMWLETTTETAALEETRNRPNESHLKAVVPTVQEATKDMFSARLTDEQARNIAVDEDSTLVLAGAGTGKTAVITGKIAHLVRNQGVPPEAILALTFNRKAALEIRERLPDGLKGAQVSTFHSFALGVVASQGTAPTISKLTQDVSTYNKAIDGILAKMMTDPGMARNTIKMVSRFSKEYRAPFDFTDPLEYEQYVRDAELRTLNRELVRSFEELSLANFLATNGSGTPTRNPMSS